MNVALVGSNFGIRGYLPVITKFKNLNLKVICSSNKKKINSSILSSCKHVSDWKKIFIKEINLIILAVPPLLQEKILKYNLKYKKKNNF